jgi:hypothetical protein
MATTMQDTSTGFATRPQVTKAAISAQELFGHVTLVESYSLPTYNGIHALIALRDTPGKTIAVMTVEQRHQTILQAALSTGYLVAVHAQRLTNPPTPRGGTWGVEVYSIDGVILYSMK